MNKLLAALLIISAPAYAEQYLVAKNTIGTDIVLTLQKPTWCEGASMMYTMTKEGDAIYGCWSYMQEKVHVKYQDGTRKIYDPTGFEVKGTK